MDRYDADLTGKKTTSPSPQAARRTDIAGAEAASLNVNSPAAWSATVGHIYSRQQSAEF